MSEVQKKKFVLSRLSLSRLEGVHPDLVKVVKRAIEITEVDFRVSEGLRTKARQAELVKLGASQTQNSRHLTGHAVDLVAMIGLQTPLKDMKLWLLLPMQQLLHWVPWLLLVR